MLDLMACHLAVFANSTSCPDGIPVIVDDLTSYGISNASNIYPYDAAGSDERDRASPAALSLLFAKVVSSNTDWGRAFYNSLAIIGVDGTEADSQVGKPVQGHARVKGVRRKTSRCQFRS